MLYGVRGPTTDEESLAYAPPEVQLSLSEDNSGFMLPYLFSNGTLLTLSGR
jgi:hypothetical protein